MVLDIPNGPWVPRLLFNPRRQKTGSPARGTIWVLYRSFWKVWMRNKSRFIFENLFLDSQLYILETCERSKVILDQIMNEVVLWNVFIDTESIDTSNSFEFWHFRACITSIWRLAPEYITFFLPKREFLRLPTRTIRVFLPLLVVKVRVLLNKKMRGKKRTWTNLCDYLGSPPSPDAIVTTRILTFLVENPQRIL